jgi:hypothetical protein
MKSDRNPSFKTRVAMVNAVNADPEQLFEKWWGQRLNLLDADQRDAEWWLVKVVAFFLDINATTVRRNISEGKYHHIRLGGKLVVHVPSLKNYLKENIRKHL